MTLATMRRDVVTGARPEVLDDIAHLHTGMAIWERDLHADRLDALALLDLDAIDDVAVELDANDAMDAMDAALRTAAYPNDAVTTLPTDIERLVRHHAALTGEDRLSVRLEVIETDACRRFHADYVTLRLLCTYVGPGTQWCHANRLDDIRRIATGAVCVLKGRLLLDPPAILHRSPPIIATGERRLVLAIDPARRPGGS